MRTARTHPSSLLVELRPAPQRSSETLQSNLRLKLNLWQNADAIPQRRPKQHVVCLHHFDRPMKLDRNLDGRTRRETTAKSDIAFLTADAPTVLRPAMDDPHRVLSFSYLVFEPSYLAELALLNGIGRPLDFIPRFATPDLFSETMRCSLTGTMNASATTGATALQTSEGGVSLRERQRYFSGSLNLKLQLRQMKQETVRLPRRALY